MIIETIKNPAWYIYWGNCTSMGKIPNPDWKPTRAWAERMLHSMDSTIELFDLYIFDDTVDLTFIETSSFWDTIKFADFLQKKLDELEEMGRTRYNDGYVKSLIDDFNTKLKVKP